MPRPLLGQMEGDVSDVVRRVTAWLGEAGRVPARRGSAGIAWPVKAWVGGARRGEDRQGTSSKQ